MAAVIDGLSGRLERGPRPAAEGRLAQIRLAFVQLKAANETEVSEARGRLRPLALLRRAPPDGVMAGHQPPGRSPPATTASRRVASTLPDGTGASGKPASSATSP